MDTTPERRPESELLELNRSNTPTIYNGWEQITRHDTGRDAVNLEPVIDYMPQMGPMVGYAVTLVIEPGNRAHYANKGEALQAYREYLASVPGPKIVVVQDLDKPRHIGSIWGEVNANVHRALGCVGGIIDGCIRDVDEMTNAGFKALAARLCVGHAYAAPVRWNCEVEVFGTPIRPGDLIHAYKHGFMRIPEDDQAELLEAVLFMDANECETVIDAARGVAMMNRTETIERISAAGRAFGEAAKKRFGKGGEWAGGKQ